MVNAGSHLPWTAGELAGATAKVAGIVMPWMSVTWQAPVPQVERPQPLNTDPLFAVARNVSTVLAG